MKAEPHVGARQPPGQGRVWLFTRLEPQEQPSPLPPADEAGPRGVCRSD